MTPVDIIAELTHRGQTVATAESLTAGLVCFQLISVPGASAVVRGGLITYATDLKASLAGVEQKLLDKEGAVHPQVALELAQGARERCQADWGLGLTGVAGPSSQDGVMPGVVYIGLAGPERSETRTNTTEVNKTEVNKAGNGSEITVVHSYHFEGGRKEVQDASAKAALDLLREHLGLVTRSLLA